MGQLAEAKTELSARLSEAGTEVDTFVTALYNDPGTMAKTAYLNLESGIGDLSDYLAELFDQTSIALMAAYDSTLSSINLFLDAPGEIAQEIYHETLSGLLNLYAELINDLLVALNSAVV